VFLSDSCGVLLQVEFPNCPKADEVVERTRNLILHQLSISVTPRLQGEDLPLVPQESLTFNGHSRL